MAVNVNVWNLMYSMRSVSRWQDTIQSNINGALRNGYKEADIVFGGNATYDAVSPTQTMLGKQIGEQAITVASTRNLWNQGDIVPTKSLTDFAINGEGFFMVYDPKNSKTYYTRDGSFRPNHTGQLTNAQGLILVDAALAINLGNTVIPFTPTSPTNAEVINNETNWQPLSTVAGNGDVPWWLNNVNATFGDDYVIQTKKTFFVDGTQLTGSETMSFGVDNIGHVFVNGVQVTPPGGVGGWPVATTLNIGPYLKDGANTIFIQAANSPGGGAFGTNPAGILTSGTVAGVNLDSNNTWAVRAAETRTLQAPLIEDTYTKPNEILLASLPKKDELRYSKYGSTIFEAFFPVLAANIGLPETGDRGFILQQYLEASNVNVEKQMVALTQSNKLQEAITKQFLVFYSNIDIGINLIK